jgi:hypothetical protein
MSGYDIIGDVHGHATKLVGLLGALGYEKDSEGVFRHPERTAIFVGDLIDRGPEQRMVIDIVRAMTDAGSSQIIMGNHELNAIAFATADPDIEDGFLRPHNQKNIHQHEAFLGQLSSAEQRDCIAWFKTMPLWLDLGELRVVHACWHSESIGNLEDALGGSTLSSDGLIGEAVRDDGTLFEGIETILKNPEINLEPYALPRFLDGFGVARNKARARWWDASATSLRDLVDMAPGTLQENGTPYPSLPNEPCNEHDRSFAYASQVPVFYGHHWRKWKPKHMDDWTWNTACVDFSAGDGGPLVAYRWNTGDEIDPENYVDFQ